MVGRHRSRKPKAFWVASIIICFFVLPVVSIFDYSPVDSRALLEPHEVAEIVVPAIESGEFPNKVDISQHKSTYKSSNASILYTIEKKAQEHIQRLFNRYNPDYGAFVAIDADTGEVLTLVSHAANSHDMGNLALRSNFPAASIFKIVTAAAAVDKGRVSVNTIIPYNGRNHTLYKKNVYHQKRNRWTRYIPLKEAFGRSINTVFGKLGLFYLEPKTLKEYAVRFGFNRDFNSDFEFDQGEALIADKKVWSIAETASGFTRKTKMSPLQGALIASAVVNEGVIMEPYIVRSISEREGKVIYQPHRKVASVAMEEDTANDMRKMMLETVRRGTARKTFRPFLKNSRYKGIEVGGKTGSLTGLHPRGKCDWFVGYAKFPGSSKKIAIATLTIHKKYWTVRSAYLARRFIENFSLLLQQKTASKQNKQTMSSNRDT